MELSLQMFSIRDVASTDMALALKQVKQAGYTGVEFAGFFEQPAEAVRDMLAENGLVPFGSHVRSTLLTDDVLDKTIAYHKTIGCNRITIPSFTLTTPQGYADFVKLVAHIEPILNAEGIALSYHNHSGEFMLIGKDKQPIHDPSFNPFALYDRLMEESSIMIQLDLYHIFAAELNPMDVIGRYRNRIASLHIRDGEGYGLAGKALGEGKAPVGAMIDAALAFGYPMIVENNNAEPTSADSAKRCCDFVMNYMKK